MEELKACNVRAMWDAVNELENAVMHPGKKKGLSTETLSIAIAAIHKIAEQTRHKNAANLRAEPESKPLTLEQLRHMEDKWVWITSLIGPKFLCCTKMYNIKNGFIHFFDNGRNQDHKEELYGKTWIAYARKPEGSEKP